MKNNKILMLLLLVGTTILLQSCLKNEEDLFGQPSSNRMDAYLDKAKNVLTGAPNGWAFEYYPNVKQAYGGFTYTLKFNTDGTVEARKEGVAAAEKSGFSIKTDAGPVLSFDTYSNLLHEYATPSSSAYQAKQGDFEFVIDSVGEDRKSTRLNSSHANISYAVFCLKKKKSNCEPLRASHTPT